MKWASTIATTARLEDAISEAAESLRSELGAAPDLAIAFVSAHYRDHVAELPSALARELGDGCVIGCSAGGVLGGDREIEDEPALAIVGATLPGVEVTSFHLGDDPAKWPAELAVDPALGPEILLLPDPFSCDVNAVLEWLDETYPDGSKLGGLASGGDAPGDNVLVAGGALHRTGCVGVALTGDVEVDIVVAQGCRPIGTPMFVTRGKDQLIAELDGTAATVALEDLVRTLPAADQALAQSSLFLGVVMRDAQEIYEHGDFLVRNLVGVDPHAGVLAVDATVHDGTVVQFHLRDAATARDDLAELLALHQYGSPAGALLFTCEGRGRQLYGQTDHETALFRKQMGSVPLAGFFCSGEIGPVGGTSYVHGYTSCLGLFRPKHKP